MRDLWECAVRGSALERAGCTALHAGRVCSPGAGMAGSILMVREFCCFFSRAHDGYVDGAGVEDGLHF